MTKRILIIDDEELIREIVELSLSKVGGWQVIEASSGDEGLRKAVTEQPDAILLDVMMPVLDGPSTLKRLKADPISKNIPVVFLTAKARQSDQSLWLELGAVGVLVKPFDPMLLPSQVARALGWLD